MACIRNKRVWQSGILGRVLNISNLFKTGDLDNDLFLAFVIPSVEPFFVILLCRKCAIDRSMADLCRRHLDLRVPDLEEETRRRLQEISPPFIRMRNPVDIWPCATVRGVEYGYREGMEAVLKDPNIDAVVPVLMLTDDTGVPTYDFIVELADRYPEKPIAR